MHAEDPSQSADSRRARLFWIFLLCGILLRLVAINQPLIDAHLVRQAQTADWTRNGFAETAWPLSAPVSWRGDTAARLALEFPLYNYLVAGVWSLTGNLDLSGKVVSIALWAFSFFVLQAIWRRLLDEQQTFWANLLFISAPLSIFFGQAFMPEMCLQLLAFLMVWSLLRYGENGRWVDYTVFATTGLLGLLVKSLEISHLYIVALLVFWKRDGIRLVARPEHWIGGLVTVGWYFAWTSHVNQVNQEAFPEWTASALSGAFLGSWTDRLNWHFYVKIVAYVTAFIAGPLGLMIATCGFLRRNDRNRFGFWWVGSLVFFYLVWGIKTAGLHSYYNLPALAPLCFLFGLGMSWLREQPAFARFFLATRGHSLGGASPIHRAISMAVLACLILPLIGCSMYLFRQDRAIYEAALWVKERSAPSDLVFLKVNHRRDNNGYPEYPVFSYYAQRRAWIDSPNLTQSDRERALATSQWAVMTRPPIESKWTHRVRDMIARYPPLQEIPDWPEPNSAFKPVLKNDRFKVFRRTTLQTSREKNRVLLRKTQSLSLSLSRSDGVSVNRPVGTIENSPTLQYRVPH